jgi:hypothetical protein
LEATPPALLSVAVVTLLPLCLSALVMGLLLLMQLIYASIARLERAFLVLLLPSPVALLILHVQSFLSSIVAAVPLGPLLVRRLLVEVPLG